MKSLTGSKKVIEILNHLGYSIDYSTIEELETEMTFQSTKEMNSTPSGMALSPNMGTGVSFDNYDRFVETLTGKDTLHDTVGIAYQVVSEESDESQMEEANVLNCVRAATHRKRRRAFDATGLDIEPYRKKPKMLTVPLLPLDDARRAIEPKSYLNARIYDSLWMMDFCFSPHDTAMWVGWNAEPFPNTHKLQKVWYLPQINQSPTSSAVVAETMRRGLRVKATRQALL